MDVGNTVIYSLQNPKMFVNFNKCPHLYFMHSNAFFWVHEFHQTLKGVYDTKHIKDR
jgi:hypothetical protein